jgi:hypothetical protein
LHSRQVRRSSPRRQMQSLPLPRVRAKTKVIQVKRRAMMPSLLSSWRKPQECLQDWQEGLQLWSQEAKVTGIK